MARYLFGSVAKAFRQRSTMKKRKKAKAKADFEKAQARTRRKFEQEREYKQAQFRKGFAHKSSIPKSFDVKPQLPTRGKRVKVEGDN